MTVAWSFFLAAIVSCGRRRPCTRALERKSRGAGLIRSIGGLDDQPTAAAPRRTKPGRCGTCAPI